MPRSGGKKLYSILGKDLQEVGKIGRDKFFSILQKHGISINMTKENHCYENATAERVDGILKDEFFLDDTFKNQAEAIRAVKEAIRIYNDYRPH